MLLTKFDLKTISQKEIKQQSLTKQLSDAPSPLVLPDIDSFCDENVLTIQKEKETWKFFVDGSNCQNGSRVGVMLIHPSGKSTPLSFHLNILCTNNTAKYEA
jgi:hypothetical protein